MSVYLHVSETSSAHLEWLDKVYLRFDEDQINEDNHIIVLDIFVGKALAPWTLCQSHPFAERPIVSLAVCRV